MITEEMLCAAAARSCEIYVSYLERGYTPENQHEFSLQFEKKIKKLKNYSILVDIYLMDMHWIETKYDLISPAILYSIIFPAVID